MNNAQEYHNKQQSLFGCYEREVATFHADLELHLFLTGWCTMPHSQNCKEVVC